jgi:hypothetical protein
MQRDMTMQKDKKLTPDELQKLVDEALAAIPGQKPAPLMVEVRMDRSIGEGRESDLRSND